ncbi:MAG: hypothetical protein HY939_01020 [Gammaproteobacteria bacterium]|nr:hypothetical protein [Gammaproteobacteria bacterium]
MLPRPSFDSHRDTNVIEKLTRKIAELEQKLQYHPLSSDPEHLPTLIDLTRIHLEAGHYEQAIELSKKIKEVMPVTQTDPAVAVEYYYILATAFREKQQYRQAADFYSKGQRLFLGLKVNDEAHKKIMIDFFRGYGIYHLCTKDYRLAAVMFNQGLRLSPGNDKAQLALENYFAMATGLAGNHNVSLRKLDEVRQKWMRVDPQVRETSMDWASHLYHTARVREKLAKKLHDAGGTQEAREEAEKAILDLKESVRLREKLFEIASIASNYTNSRVADPLWLLGKLSISIGQKEEGEAYLSRAKACYLAMDPDSAQKKAGRIEEKWLSSSPKRHSIFAAAAPVECDLLPPVEVEAAASSCAP